MNELYRPTDNKQNGRKKDKFNSTNDRSRVKK